LFFISVVTTVTLLLLGELTRHMLFSPAHSLLAELLLRELLLLLLLNNLLLLLLNNLLLLMLRLTLHRGALSIQYHSKTYAALPN
jgi:hypothetical protein